MIDFVLENDREESLGVDLDRVTPPIKTSNPYMSIAFNIGPKIRYTETPFIFRQLRSFSEIDFGIHEHFGLPFALGLCDIIDDHTPVRPYLNGG